MKTILLLTALSICSGLAAQIIHVPDDQPTIQQGIYAASDGDTVLVDEGTYYENISFWGKAITVASRFIMDGDTGHISNTIINGSQPVMPDYGSVVTFEMGEDTTSVLCGFTITGGSGTWISYVPIVTGGGILCNNSGATIRNNFIEYNNIDSYYNGGGGGISAGPPETASYIVIKNNRIAHNSVFAHAIAEGGGLEIYCNGTVTCNEITDNWIESSEQYGVGAGACIGNQVQSPVICVTDNIISDNVSASTSTIDYHASGGGLFIVNYHGMIRHNTISENVLSGQTSGRGAGICLLMTDTNLIIESNRIDHNYFEELSCQGGGIYCQAAGVKILNNAIVYNSAAYGGGIYSYDEHTQIIHIINSTITENEAQEDGCGIYLYGSQAFMMNTIVWGNYGGSAQELIAMNSDVEVVYSDVYGGWTGEGNMDEDPEFADDTLFHLSGGSLCQDAGTESFMINGTSYQCPPADYEGDPRPAPFGAPDIGADECFHVGMNELQVAGCRLQVFPNPARGEVFVRYKVPVGSWQLAVGNLVNLNVYNIQGQKIMTFDNKDRSQGEHVVRFDVSRIPAGIYFIRLQAGNQLKTVKMIKL